MLFGGGARGTLCHFLGGYKERRAAFAASDAFTANGHGHAKRRATLKSRTKDCNCHRLAQDAVTPYERGARYVYRLAPVRT